MVLEGNSEIGGRVSVSLIVNSFAPMDSLALLYMYWTWNPTLDPYLMLKDFLIELNKKIFTKPYVKYMYWSEVNKKK